MKDRRRYPRYDISLEVEYHYTNGITVEEKTYAFNVSEVGISIPLNKALKPGDKVKLKIKLPSEKREIDVTGKVVWRRPITWNIPEDENAGIEFMNMGYRDKKVLREYVRNYTN